MHGGVEGELVFGEELAGGVGVGTEEMDGEVDGAGGG